MPEVSPSIPEIESPKAELVKNLRLVIGALSIPGEDKEDHPRPTDELIATFRTMSGIPLPPERAVMDATTWLREARDLLEALDQS